MERKGKPCAVATVSRKISVCRQLFAEALDRGLIEVNPATRVRGFTVSQESKTLRLSRNQAKELLDSVETDTLLGLRDKAMLSLMIRTGLRRMDVIGASIGRLGQREGHCVLTMMSKGNKERTVKIPVEIGTTIHLAFETLQASDVPLRRTVTPRLTYCGINCTSVLF